MISPDQLAEIAREAGTHQLGDAMLPALRSAFPGIHFSFCMDDDVSYETAALEADRFNLYLVDGRDHCMKFTTDPAAATGLVIAEISDDE